MWLVALSTVGANGDGNAGRDEKRNTGTEAGTETRAAVETGTGGRGR